MKNYKLYLLVGLLCITSSIFGQQPTSVSIELNAGSNPSCAGNTIQVNADLIWLAPPARPQDVSYEWTKSQESVNGGNSVRVDFVAGRGGSGNGEDSSFLRESLNETTTYSLRVAGILSQQFTIVVNDLPKAGEDNPPVFLCDDAPFDLSVRLNGTPDSGGAWSPQLASGTNIFDPAIDEPGVYEYTVQGTPPCPAVSSRVVVSPCGNDDFDGDGVDNLSDNDQDNDGIPDSIEDNLCITSVIDLTPSRLAIDDNFGEGVATTSSFVSPLLQFEAGIPQDDGSDPSSLDGEYVVATSRHIFDSNGERGETAPYLSTELNGHEDADGNPNGRFLAINMKTESFIDGIIYEQTNLPVTAGLDYILSMSVANLDAGGVRPRLSIEIVSINAGGVETIEASVDTGLIENMADEWQVFPIPFTASGGVRSVTLRIRNRNAIGGLGNDLGIDNIMLGTLECDFDGDGIPNKIDLDSDNDGIYDAVEAGINPSFIDADGIVTGGVNGSGVPNNGVTIAPDTDGDGFPDFLDLDSDADGCSDANEAYFDSEADGGDGEEFGVKPFDPADIIDFNGLIIDAAYSLPEDFDGDSVSDYTQAGPFRNGSVIPMACEDTSDNDEDTVSDDVDVDDDNDGILDVDEYMITVDPLAESNGTLLYLDTTNAAFIDTNSDGVDDRFDFDLDGIINQFDVDSDNDGIYDHVEAGLALVEIVITEEEDYGQIGLDTEVNNDLGSPNPGFLTATSIASLTPSSFSDGDSLPDFLDIDADGDGILDNYEAQPTNGYVAPSNIDANENGADDAYEPDALYNLTFPLNPLLNADTDADGTPDYLSINSDGDCLNDVDEAFDSNQDGISDIIETADTNNDGLNDAYEGTPLVAAFPNNHNSSTAEVDYREEFDEDPVVIPATDALVLCSTDTLTTLFDELSAFTTNETGLWTGPSASGEAFDWQIDPTTDTAGDYVYTITLGACEKTFTLPVDIIEAPYAGDDNLLATVCESETTTIPFDFLTGSDVITENGTWTSTDVTTLPTAFDGALTIDTSLMVDDTIELTYTVGAGDCTDMSTVIITITSGRFAGADVTDVVYCNDLNDTIDLFTLLSGAETDIASTWTATFESAPITLTPGSESIINPSQLDAGSYEYTYTLPMSTNGCDGAEATIQFTIDEALYAGEDTILMDPLCVNNSNAVTLITLLETNSIDTITENGVWSFDSTDLVGGDINLSTFPIDQDLVFTYTVTSPLAGGCSEQSAQLTLSLSEDRDAGADAIIPPFCDGSTDIINIFDFLDADTDDNGVWTAVGVPSPTDTLATIDVSTLSPGIYTFTYTLPAIGECSADSAVVTLEILDEIVAPTITDDVVFACEGSPNPPISVDVAAGLSVNWYLEEDDLVAIFTGTSFTPTETNAGQYNYFVRASNGSCESENLELTFQIIPAPFEDDFQDGFVCLSGGDFTGVGIENIQTINSTSIFNFQWFKDNAPVADATGDSFTPDGIGTYHLQYTSIENNCVSESAPFEITGIEEPILTLEQANGEFSTEPTLVATVTNANPNTEYEYILDGGTPQESPVFENVEPGPHTVEVLDLFGCGGAFADKYVIGFPKFFTPNNDGTNDFWNVILDPAEPMNISIFIFDRYGKLLIQMFSTDPLGWDGKFVGRDLPSNDYWFKAVDEATGETRTGHFTLKR